MLRSNCFYHRAADRRLSEEASSSVENWKMFNGNLNENVYKVSSLNAWKEQPGAPCPRPCSGSCLTASSCRRFSLGNCDNIVMDWQPKVLNCFKYEGVENFGRKVLSKRFLVRTSSSWEKKTVRWWRWCREIATGEHPSTWWSRNARQWRHHLNEFSSWTNWNGRKSFFSWASDRQGEINSTPAIFIRHRRSFFDIVSNNRQRTSSQRKRLFLMKWVPKIVSRM